MKKHDIIFQSTEQKLMTPETAKIMENYYERLIFTSKTRV